MLVTILATVVVLGVLIFVHELGHFLAAKAVDIEVPTFSIGLGPKMTGFRRGETEYVISWLPLGGYVKMAGMAEEAAVGRLEGGVQEGRPPSGRDFEAKPLWARTLVICAGVFMNFLFAFAAFAALAHHQGVLDPVVTGIEETSPAAVAGLREGDRFLAIDGQRIRAAFQVPMLIQERPEREIPLLVERDGREVRLLATPRSVRAYNEVLGDTVSAGRLGIAIGEHRDVGWGQAVVEGARQTGDWCILVLEFLWRLLSGESSARELGGPIMIGQISGAAARAGFSALLGFMAVISVNLAILNLLPIPVLDGGHLVFLLVEAVRGRALSMEQRLRMTQIGMVVVVGIMIWAIGNDILRLVGI